MLDYLLEKVEKAELIVDPFPHIIIDNFLNEDDLKSYLDEIIHLENSIDKSSNSSISRAEISYDKKNQNSILNKVSYTLESQKFIEVNKKKFQKYNPKEIYKINIHANPNMLVFNPPVGEESLSPRGPHLDPYKEIFNWLFYLKEEAEKYADLYLYSYKDKFRGFDYGNNDKNTIPQNDLKREKTIKCSPNKFFLFLNSYYSVHSVGYRKPFSGIRVYLTGGVVSKKSLYWPINKMQLGFKFKYLLFRPIQRILILLSKSKS